ncbi:MAG: ATP-grasp domain-containing protein [Acidimicrobiia bacterium]
MVRRLALILPSSTYRAREFVRAARAVDAEMVIATEEEQLLIDDAHLVGIDLSRPEWSAEQIVSRGPFDAVISVDDGGVMIGAVTAAALNLPHSTPAAVAATRDKSAMRDLFGAAGVPQPDYRIVTETDEAAEAAAAIGFPVIIKPVSLSASQGVIRVDDADGVESVVEQVRRIASAMGRDSTLLVEEFIPGPEVALEAMLADGHLIPLAILDKPDPLDGPYFEETMLVTPSRHPAEAQDSIVSVVAAAAAALGLREGPVHAEARVGPDGVRILEVAARPIGGLCSRALEFGMLGASLETVLVRHALRLPQGGLDAAAPASGVMMIPIPKAGRLASVSGIDEARDVAGITGVEITVPLGERLRPLPEGNCYLGFIFARALQPLAVEEALRQAHGVLKIEVT